MSSYSDEEKCAASPADLDLFVEDLIEQMQAHFADMGHSILGRMDNMGTRIDELEQSIASLLLQAGLDQNGFHNNTSFDTATSMSSQGRAKSLRIPTATPHHSTTSKVAACHTIQSPSSSVVPATATPTTSVPPPISVVEDSSSTPSHSHIVSPTEQDITVAPSRTRITIEI